MFVARTTLRRSPGRRARSWSSAGRLPCSGRTSHALATGQRPDRPPGAADLLGPRQEDEDVAPSRTRPVATSSTAPAIASADAGRAVGRYDDLDRERPPLGLEHGAIAEEPGDGPGVHRGRHDDQDQVVADRLADLAEEGQGEVGVQAPLVELVEHDRADAFEEGVGDELAVEDALGHHAEAGPGPVPLLEADVVADLLAERPAVLVGDPPRHGPRGDPPRLEQDQRGVVVGEQAGADDRRRDAGRLARPRGRDQDQGPALPQPRHDLGQERIDRQGRHAGQSVKGVADRRITGREQDARWTEICLQIGQVASGPA